MKTCIACGLEKELSEFTMRKRPPIKPYAACKSCEVIAYKMKPKKAYSDEMRELRDKAKDLRKFNPEQDLDLARRVKAGEFRNALAKEYGVSKSAVGKAVLRGLARLDKA